MGSSLMTPLNIVVHWSCMVVPQAVISIVSLWYLGRARSPMQKVIIVLEVFASLMRMAVCL